MENRALFGAWGEAQAAAYLKRKRFRVVAQNFAVRGGEIDLIAESREFLLFVEVKTRKTASFAAAREYVDARKQARLHLAAELWLAGHETALQPRFDVIEVYAPDGVNTRRPEIVHWENVF